MGFIQFLSKAGQRVYHFLIDGLKKGLPGTEIMKTLRQHGLGYRLQDFYNDLRILKGEMEKWDTMKFVPRFKVISDKLYTPSEKVSKNFMTVFEITYFDPEVGEYISQHVAVGHNAPMRRADLEQEALNVFCRYPKFDSVEECRNSIAKIMPVRGFKRVR